MDSNRRTNVIGTAVIAAVFISAYGFSIKDILVQWIVPGVLLAVATGYAFWPRSGGSPTRTRHA